MKVFLFANMYVQYNILEHLSSVLGFTIDSLVLLKESLYNPNDLKFCLSDTLIVDNTEEGVNHADTTVIIPYDIPQKSIEEVVVICNRLNKKNIVLSVNSLYDKMEHTDSIIRDSFAQMYVSKKPVVLILRSGKFTQITKLQLAINCHFGCRGYNFGQIFSNEFLSGPDDKTHMESVVKEQLEKLQQNEREFDFTIITWPFELLSSLELLGEYMKYLRPNYCVMCVENNFRGFNDFRKLFAYKFDVDLDAFISSEYVSVIRNNEEIYLYIGKTSNNQCKKIDEVCTSIVTKLTYPKGIMPIL